MKLPINSLDRTTRSTASQTPQSRTLRSIYSGVVELWQTIGAHAAGTGEPRVWQTQDETSRLWNAYDPATQQTLRQVSSQELRVWLETRHDRIG